MIYDNRLTKLAKVLVHYSTEVKEKEMVNISGSTASEPLLREIFREVLLSGAHSRIHMQFEDQQYLFYSLGKKHQLSYTDPLLMQEMEMIDVFITTIPDLNPHALSSIQPEKKQMTAKAQEPVREIMFRRWAEGKFRWVGSVYPTAALAQEAHMSRDEYTEFVFASMHLNDDDPATFWKNFSRKQQKICDHLNHIDTMRYVGEDTDLSFSCKGRTWINCDGKNNFPDGEVFTGPVEDSIEGTIWFSYPGIYMGEEIEDIFLKFSRGKVVEAKAAKGEALLQKLLEIDKGARYVGEIAIGTNHNITRFSKNMLFDEKMGHTVHLALGRGIPESGSKNLSAIHWDMLKDMREGGKIFGDGKLLYENGEFLI